MSKKQYYVVDTSILIDYVDIIQPNGYHIPLEEPTIDLTKGTLVIPSAVIRELDDFKTESSDRGLAARAVLRRIRDIVESVGRTMKEVYEVREPLSIMNGEQEFIVQPVDEKFMAELPFHPSDDDMDGQIILTALVIAFHNAGLPVNGTAPRRNFMDLKMDGVVLLTNDNGLAIRAWQRGLKTSRFGYKFPEPYTGRRDVVVPKELFLKFYNGDDDGVRQILREEFEACMPSSRPLAANEFIVMSLEDVNDYPIDFDPESHNFFSNIGRYDVESDAIVPLRYATSFPVFPMNAGQAIYAEALMDPEISAIICTGPAGSGKTYMATIYGYNACKDGDFIGVTAVPCESRSKLGALPGDINDKMDPEVKPLKNALKNYLLKEDKKLKKELSNLKEYGTDTKCKTNGDSACPEKRSIKAKLEDRVNLIWENWFTSTPIENARGRDFSYELAIYDEFQDQNSRQADTLIKRIGESGKIILTGDVEQVHAPYLDKTNNGLVYATRQLYDLPMVAQVNFTEDEVIRNDLVKEVVKRQKARK